VIVASSISRQFCGLNQTIVLTAMKLYFKFLSVLCFTCVLFSCKKDSGDSTIAETPDPVGVPTEVGVPDGTPAVKKTIGAQGGSIASSDGRITVNIPSGALTENQEISVQSISNFNPLGIGKAFRLEPHDIQFEKPVTITFSYEEEDIINTIPEALAIAYQDEEGIWQARGGVIVDKANKKVTATTTHFSDWSLFESFYFYCSATMLPVKNTAELEVITAEDLLVPLVETEEAPIGNKVSMAARYVKEWKLAGAGKLQSNGPKATYTAPNTVPRSPNPIAVSVSLDLNKRGKFLLVKHITIVDDAGFIEVSAGGGTKTQMASRAVKTPSGYYSIADADGDAEGSYVVIRWKGEEGTYGYKSPFAQEGNYAHYLITGGAHYTCMYIDGNGNLKASGGGITITDMNDNGYIVGTFVIDPAGVDDLTSTAAISGKFRVKRGW
jgi:hypothetical protein